MIISIDGVPKIATNTIVRKRRIQHNAPDLSLEINLTSKCVKSDKG
jgi:hypothetical protein